MACDHRYDQIMFDAETSLHVCICGATRADDDAAVFIAPVPPVQVQKVKQTKKKDVM